MAESNQGTELLVHPVADLFPMLPAEELKDLAADIADRGLLQPIVLDKDGRILDGRNRHAACGIAGVEPVFTTYDGDDPDGYALAVNIARRHLTTGARAMIAAKATRLAGRGSQIRIANFTDLQNSRISEAAQVLDWCDAATANSVIAGDLPLTRAVDEARRLKKEDVDREAKKERLRKGAPDLFTRVGEEVLSLDDAIAALDARIEKSRQEAEARKAERAEEEALQERERQVAVRNMRSVLTYLTSTALTPKELADDYADAVEDFSRTDLDFAARTMSAIAKLRK